MTNNFIAETFKEAWGSYEEAQKKVYIGLGGAALNLSFNVTDLFLHHNPFERGVNYSLIGLSIVAGDKLIHARSAIQQELSHPSPEPVIELQSPNSEI